MTARSSPGPFSTLERVAQKPIGWWLVAIWAFAEALWLPIVPDFLLCLLVLAAPRRAGALFLAVVAGSMLGSLVLYAAAVAAPEVVRTIVLAVPGVRPEMLDQASTLLAGGDPIRMAGFGPGTPLKVETVAWRSGRAVRSDWRSVSS